MSLRSRLRVCPYLALNCTNGAYTVSGHQPLPRLQVRCGMAVNLQSPHSSAAPLPRCKGRLGRADENQVRRGPWPRPC